MEHLEEEQGGEPGEEGDVELVSEDGEGQQTLCYGVPETLMQTLGIQTSGGRVCVPVSARLSDSPTNPGSWGWCAYLSLD